MNTRYHGAHWGTGNYQNLKTGWLCLDFANTADWHASDAPEEQIPSYDELLSWALEKALLDETAAENLRVLAQRSTNKAQQAHQEANELREVLYRIFSTIATNHDPAEADLDRLNHYLSRTLPHLQLRVSAEGYQWGWRDEPELDSIPWPIVWSASRLLTSKFLTRVGQCADDRGCGWLFIDMSKNHSRRWCDMKDCGNRDKVRRYYARQRDPEVQASL